MLMLSVIFVIVGVHFLCRFVINCLCIAVGDQVIKKGTIGIPLTDLIHHMCLPVPTQDADDFQPYLCRGVLFRSGVWGDRFVVRFIHIGGMVEYQCLNLILINTNIIVDERDISTKVE